MEHCVLGESVNWKVMKHKTQKSEDCVILDPIHQKIGINCFFQIFMYAYTVNGCCTLCAPVHTDITDS